MDSGKFRLLLYVGSQVSVCVRRSTLHPTAMSEGELPRPWQVATRSGSAWYVPVAFLGTSGIYVNADQITK